VLRRCLVANRGEIAVRIIRACRELGIEAVAVHSTADRDAMHVRMADRSVQIGPPAASESYLRVDRLIAAAQTTGCDSVHPGYGFLAESTELVRACAEHDLVWIGPSAEAIETMGDKAVAKDTMRAAGLPLVPGSGGRLSGPDEAAVVAEEAGYPVLLKAAAGGGGKGMRLVRDPAEVRDAFLAASTEAEAAFGDAGMYLEKAVVDAHHIEIQVLGDGRGGGLVLGERECSIQRRHQKLIEESPSPFLAPETLVTMEAAAADALRALDYAGAGTIEFLVGADQAFYFMEMNTRLQVEHPVTEEVTGFDLVQAQLSVAGGDGVPAWDPSERRGHAIEFRINAEDPMHGFRPGPGLITRFRPPLGPGIRIDTFVEDGATVPPFYDSMIAKLIVTAPNRQMALDRAARALDEFVVEGIPTTIPLLREIVDEPAFRAGRYTTTYLDEVGASLASLGEG
jgi:acetyl-CoA carboxylase biotin carboxylase subunit